MKEENKLKNIEIDEEMGVALFKLNPKIYPLDIIYSAAYIMIDKAFIVLDGNPDAEILVELKKKKYSQNIKELVEEFNEELLNYSVYKIQSDKNKKIRELILQRLMITNNPSYFKKVKDGNKKN